MTARKAASESFGIPQYRGGELKPRLLVSALALTDVKQPIARMISKPSGSPRTLIVAGRAMMPAPTIVVDRLKTPLRRDVSYQCCLFSRQGTACQCRQV
jgi:hypothetical protein